MLIKQINRENHTSIKIILNFHKKVITFSSCLLRLMLSISSSNPFVQEKKVNIKNETYFEILLELQKERRKKKTIYSHYVHSEL